MSQFRRVKEPSSWRRLSLGAWTRPQDPSIYGWLDIDVSRARVYLDALNRAQSTKVTLTHLVGKAVALAIAERPEINAVVRRGQQVYVRDTVDVFFQVAYEGGENLSGAKVGAADSKSLVEIAAELADKAARIREHAHHDLKSSDDRLRHVPAQLRRAVLRAIELGIYDLGLDLSSFGIPSDAFGSAMITNIGVFGLPRAFAPLVPFTRVPIVITVGAIRDAPVAEDGQVVVRPIVTLGVTLDHRLLDGYQAGKLAQRFQAVLNDPQRALGA